MMTAMMIGIRKRGMKGYRCSLKLYRVERIELKPEKQLAHGFSLLTSIQYSDVRFQCERECHQKRVCVCVMAQPSAATFVSCRAARIFNGAFNRRAGAKEREKVPVRSIALASLRVGSFELRLI